METIIIRPENTAKSKMILDFLKKERIKSEVIKEPSKSQVLKGIEKGAKETAQFIQGKIQLRSAKHLLSEL